MKNRLPKILLVALLNAVMYTAEGEELSSSPSDFNVAIADIRAVQKASVARQKMYMEANELSANLELVVEQLQQLAQERFNVLSQQASLLIEEDRDERVERHRLWVEASERFIIERRLTIETKVSNLDERIRVELIDHVIRDYVDKKDIDLLLRDTQVLYSTANDVTQDLILMLNERDIPTDLGLSPLTLDEALLEIENLMIPKRPWSGSIGISEENRGENARR